MFVRQQQSNCCLNEVSSVALGRALQLISERKSSSRVSLRHVSLRTKKCDKSIINKRKVCDCSSQTLNKHEDIKREYKKKG